MNHNPAVWFEIYVQDLERARAFYESVFQIKLEKLNSPDSEMWTFPMSSEKPGASGAIVKMPGVSAGGNSVLIYFGCEDCAVEAARVETAGGKIQQPKMSIGEYGFISLVFDPENNLIGLHSQR
jgi:hypothetical protein